MLRPHLVDAPAQGGDTDQPLGEPQRQAPDEQKRQAQKRQAHGPGRKQGQHPAAGNAQQAIAHSALAAEGVSHPPGERAAEEGGQVLQANGQPRDYRTKAQLVMHMAGQHRDRQADAEKRYEGVEDNRQDLQGDSEGMAGGGGLLRGHGLVRGRAVGRGVIMAVARRK